MEKDALELLQQTAIAANDGRQERMPEGSIALPDNFKVHDLESFMPTRKRFRGAYSTNVLADFVSYLKTNAPVVANKPSNVQCYINAERFSAKAIFNLYEGAEAGHADWTGTLTLEKTTAYAAMLGINGKPMDQQQLIDWLEDWASYITVSGSMLLGNAVAAIRQMQVKASRETTSEVGNFRAAGSVLDEIEARSKLELPEAFLFSVTPYLGLSSRIFNLQLRVLTGGDKPKLVLRAQALEAEQEVIITEFKTVLRKEIGDDIPVYIGEFKA